MRSSGSTPSPLSDPPIPLFVRFLEEDDPRRCTGHRLLERGLVRRASGRRDGRPEPITLDPFARAPLCARDRERAESAGFLVVDGSWNRLSARSRLSTTEGRSGRGSSRRLPLLVATNPQHFGRWTQLTTAEALAAAVYLVGRPREAERLLAGLRGGPAFLEINRARLDRFARASSRDEVTAAEREIFGAPPPDQEAGPGREGGLTGPIRTDDLRSTGAPP
jgi:pre-rRNA-processing protein TSR3